MPDWTTDIRARLAGVRRAPAREAEIVVVSAHSSGRSRGSAAAILVVIAALVASLIPANRAATVDPTIALRAE